ncbi:MAG: hypothetical protein PHQ27_06790, partial [Victivallales bacterium]|nr:hypothetical protein [Victivallales bacterium]
MGAGKSGRYVVMLLLSGVLGGALSLFGGEMAIIRGVILGLSLTMPIPLIDISLVAKGRDAVWKAALIGGGCGLVGGVAIWWVEFLLGDDFGVSLFHQPLTVYLLVPPVYGLLVHAVYSFCRRRGYNFLWTFNWLLLVGVAVGFVRFYPLYFPWPDDWAALVNGVVMALAGSVSTTAFFTVLWAVLVCSFDDRAVRRNGSGIILTQLVLTGLTFMVPAGSVMIGWHYNDMVFEARIAADTGLLRLLPEAVMAGNKLVTAKKSMVFPTEYRGERVALLALRRDMVVVRRGGKIEVWRGDGKLLSFDDQVAVALAPSGTRLAVLSPKKEDYPWGFERVTFYRLPDGGKIGAATGTFYRQ